MRAFVIVAALVGSSVAVAKPAPPPDEPTDATVKAKLPGTYAWDGTHVCQKTGKALLARVAQYDCDEQGQTASGRPAVAFCNSPDGRRSYVFFAKRPDCDHDRKTSLHDRKIGKQY